MASGEENNNNNSMRHKSRLEGAARIGGTTTAGGIDRENRKVTFVKCMCEI